MTWNKRRRLMLGSALLALAFALFALRRGSLGEARNQPSGAKRVAIQAREIAWKMEYAAPTSHGAHWAGIVEGAGKPIAGARVCARAPEEIAVQYAHQECATTDVSGRFELGGLTAAAYVLTAEARGFAPESYAEGTPLAYEGARDDLHFTLERGGAKLEGVVEDATGGVISSASVRFSQLVPKRIATEARTDDDGRFEAWLSEGTVVVTVDVAGYATERQLTTAPGEVRVRLSPASRVSGLVVTEDGTPVEGVTVSVMPAFQAGIPIGARAVSDGEGEFQLDGVGPGQYAIDARGGAYQGGTLQPFDVSLGENTQGVRVFVRRGNAVRGRVLDETSGTPCRQGFVSLGPPDPVTPPAPEVAAIEGGPVQRSAIHGDGTVEFPGVPEGSYHVTVLCVGSVYAAGPRFLRLQADSVQELAWKVRRAGKLTVRVIDGSGRALPHYVYALQLADGPGGRPGARLPMETDGAGISEVPGIPAGEHTLTAMEPDEAEPQRVRVAGTAVAQATLRLKQSGTIAVSVVDARGAPLSSVQVEATSEESGSKRAAIARGAGRYELAPLPAGSYVVRARDGLNPEFGPEQAGATVRVANGSVASIKLVAPARGRITGKVLSPEGEPAANVWVSTIQTPADPHAMAPEGSNRVLTGTDGTFSIDGLTLTATFKVRADEPHGVVTMSRAVHPGDFVTMTLPQAATLSGVVLDERGNPVTHCYVRALSSESATERAQVVLNADGAFVFNDLPPGPVVLSASAQAGQAESAPLVLSAGVRTGGVVLKLGAIQTL